MPKHPNPEYVTHDWENEGGSLSPLTDGDPLSGVTRFLTAVYVVDGCAYASFSDAIARQGALQGARTL